MLLNILTFQQKNKQDKNTQKEITFLKGFVDVNLTSDKVLVILHIGKDTSLVDPVVVMGAEKEDREVPYVMTEALNVCRDQTRIADLSRPPPKETRIPWKHVKKI